MILRPARSTLTDTLFPDTTLFRSKPLPQKHVNEGSLTIIRGPQDFAALNRQIMVKRISGLNGLVERRVFGPVSAWMEIGRAHVCTPVTNEHLVCRLLLEKKKYNKLIIVTTDLELPNINQVYI